MVERILVVAPHLGALTDYARTLEDLTAHRYLVHIAVGGDSPPGTDLTSFTGKFRRLTIGAVPPPDRWLALGTAVRRRPGRRRLERHLPSSPRVLDFLRVHEPDVLIVVPLFGAGSMQGYVQAAAELGIATLGFPSHWDDLAHGAVLHRLPDCLALWNRFQLRQAVDSGRVPADRAVILGASLPLDIVREPQAPALAPERRVIFCAPGPATDWGRLTQWIESVRADANDLVRDAHVLIYLAPPGGVQQSAYTLAGDVHIVPDAESNPSRYAAEVAGALAIADVVVAWDMTMVFEAAARGKAVVALLWPGEADPGLARVCADQDMSHGWLTAARTLQEHTAAIGAFLTTPLTVEQRASARALVRPHGQEVLPGSLLSRVLQEVVDRRVEMPPATSARPWTRLLLSPLATRAFRRAPRLSASSTGNRGARVLVALASAKSLFLHQPLLRVLAERGHQITIAFTARTRFPVELYDKVRCDVPGVTVAGVLPERTGIWAECVRALLGVFGFGSLVHRRPPAKPVPAWLARYAETVLPGRVRHLGTVMLRLPLAARLLPRAARTIARLIPSSSSARQMVLDQQADVVAVLPEDEAVAAFESAGAQVDLIGAAESLGIPVIAGVGACEMQTQPLALSRARAISVWNDEQRRAAINLGVPDDRLVVVGALPLERALCEDPIVDDQSFREMLGLPRDGPFVFFAGSSGLMSEPAEEVELIRAWVRSLRTSDDPVLRQLAVLIRPSPLGTPRWRQMENELGGGVVVCPRTFERSGELDAVLLAESVRFAALTIGADPLTLMMAAGLGRPAALIVPPRFATPRAIPLDYVCEADGSSVHYVATPVELSECVCRVLSRSSAPSSDQFRRRYLQGSGQLPAAAIADRIERLAAESWRSRSTIEVERR